MARVFGARLSILIFFVPFVAAQPGGWARESGYIQTRVIEDGFILKLSSVDQNLPLEIRLDEDGIHEIDRDLDAVYLIATGDAAVLDGWGSVSFNAKAGLSLIRLLQLSDLRQRSSAPGQVRLQSVLGRCSLKVLEPSFPFVECLTGGLPRPGSVGLDGLPCPISNDASPIANSPPDFRIAASRTRRACRGVWSGRIDRHRFCVSPFDGDFE